MAVEHRRSGWIEFQVTRGALGTHGSIDAAISAVPAAAAHVLASHIQRRIRRGQLAGQWGKPYPGKAGRKSRRVVPAEYDAGGVKGVEIPRLNAVVYESSQELHASTKTNSYTVSGGLLESLAVVVSKWAAKIAFRGRSIGQRVKWKTYKSGKRKGKKVSKTDRIANAQKVSNALKAWTVVTTKGVNLLALTRQEVEAIGAGVVAAYSGPDGFLPNVRWGKRPSMGPLAVEISRRLRR